MSGFRIRKRDGQVVDLDISQITARIMSLVAENKLFGGYAANVDANLTPAATVNLILERVLAKIAKLSVTIIETSYIDDLTVDVCIALSEVIADAADLARILSVSNMQKQRSALAPLSAEAYVLGMTSNRDPYTCAVLSWLDERTATALRTLPSFIKYRGDYDIPAEGLLTLRGQYLYKTIISRESGAIHERTESVSEKEIKRIPFELPSEMFGRMAIQLSRGPIPEADEVATNYHYLQSRLCTMSTPVMTRSGTNVNSLAACYLTYTKDSVDSIFDRLKTVANLSAGGGGIGVDMQNTREVGGYLRSTGGTTQGLLCFSGVLAETAGCVHQSSRKGSTAIYIHPTHPEIVDFIQTRSEVGNGIKRPTLFPGTMCEELFFRRAFLRQKWTLIPPTMCRDLIGLHGDAFDTRYRYYEKLYAGHELVKRISAFDLLVILMRANVETGFPYIISKTNCYRFSNQLHMQQLWDDVLLVMNLCTEIPLMMRYGEAAVCILGSIAVSFCVHYDLEKDVGAPFTLTADGHSADPSPRGKTPLFSFPAVREYVLPKLFSTYHSFEALKNMMPQERIYGKFGAYLDLVELGLSAYQQTIMLNNIFEHNMYADEGARRCSLRDRPIGVGQQGLFDAYTMLAIQADTPRGRHLNRVIQGVIYFFCLLASADVARQMGKPYDTYAGSPFSQGKFQFDLRNDYISARLSQLKASETPLKNRWAQHLILIEPIEEVNWAWLRAYVAEHGVANSMLTSIQPTETSAKINCLSEMCEPRRSNKHVIRNENQTTIIRNPHLTRLCNVLGYDIAAIQSYLDEQQGSILGCPNVPEHMQLLFRGVWEYDPKFLIDMTADREAYIDLAQSHNVYMQTPDIVKLIDYTAYAMAKMLKTFNYYTRVPEGTTFRASQENSGLAARVDSTFCEACAL